MSDGAGEGDAGARVVVVTGGSNGIGRAACLAFGRTGASVVVHFNSDRAAAEEVVAEVFASGGRAIAVQADVGEPAAVSALFDRVRAFGGDRLDVLFNNAGIYPVADLQTLDVDEWDRVMAVNVRGPLLCSQAALALLRASPSGRIINISSNTVFRVPPRTVAYTTSKAAVIGLTRALARELGEARITVNCVIPSLIATDNAARVFGSAFAGTVASQAIARPQDAQDLIELVLFLASDGARFITGQTINADGGLVYR